jgi:hypothetical protein
MVSSPLPGLQPLETPLDSLSID